MSHRDKIKTRQYNAEYRKTHAAQIKLLKRRWDMKHPERIKQFRDNHKLKNIEWLLQWLGSNRIWCDRCKYDKSFAALQLHHLDPNQKENPKDSLGHWLRFSLNRFQDKILNTQFLILCANCHAEYHVGIWK